VVWLILELCRIKEVAMASRRTAAHCHRRGAHHARRTGGIMRQEGESKSEGADDSPRAAKAAKAWKPRQA
jgi:hypothetical protein